MLRWRLMYRTDPLDTIHARQQNVVQDKKNSRVFDLFVDLAGQLSVLSEQPSLKKPLLDADYVLWLVSEAKKSERNDIRKMNDNVRCTVQQ